MRTETYLHPNYETRQELLHRMYNHASDIDFTETNWVTLGVTKRNRLAEEMVRYVLFQIQFIHTLETVVIDLEIQGLVAYLNSRHGQLDYKFLDEAYRVYNQAIKREIVQTSRIPRLASFLWNASVFVTNAKDQVLDEYS